MQKTDWRYQSVAEKMFVYPSIIITNINIKIEKYKIKSNILQLSIMYIPATPMCSFRKVCSSFLRTLLKKRTFFQQADI